jgi:hypothetical protein
VDTGAVAAVFTTRGGVLKSWRLKRYTLEDGKAVDLVASTGGRIGPLFAWSGKLEDAALPDFDVDRERLELHSPAQAESLTFSSPRVL